MYELFASPEQPLAFLWKYATHCIIIPFQSYGVFGRFVLAILFQLPHVKCLFSHLLWFELDGILGIWKIHSLKV